MDVVISGIGWVTAGGPGWGGGGQAFAMTDGPLQPLTRKEVFAEPNQRFGRQSDYSRLGLAAVAFALRDAGLEAWTEKRRIGVIAATTFGCLATDRDYYQTLLPQGGGLPSPNLFAYTLANCFMGEAAIQFGLTGSTLVVNETGGNGGQSLRMALESISWGEHDTMLAGICDLAAPAPYADVAAPPPGALFLVLTRKALVSSRNYGAISITEDGALQLNDIQCGDIVELATACLLNI